MTRIRKSLTMISHQEFIVPALKTKGKRESRTNEKKCRMLSPFNLPFLHPPPKQNPKNTHHREKKKKEKP